MPFGVIGILLVILLILSGIFGVLAYVTASLVIPMAIYFFLVCVLMMLVILIQRPKGGGLAGAFGGVGGGQQTAFGAKVGDVLTWVTVGFFVLFLVLAMGLTWEIKAQQTAVGVLDLGTESSDSELGPDIPGGIAGSGGEDLPVDSGSNIDTSDSGEGSIDSP